MPAKPKLDGLVAWTRRPDWRDTMADALDRHAVQACAAADLDPDDPPDLLGDAYGPLWGTAFEDLLATDRPDGRNLADYYFKRRGWTEPAATRDYIAARRHSVISLDEVSEVVPGESMLLRDLVRVAEPVRAVEHTATHSLHH